MPEYSVSCDPDQFEYMLHNWNEEITIPCSVTAGGVEYSGCTMRIRGDTSRGYRKKSYRIEFPPDQPHMGRVSWNLNAEYLDHSYIRGWLFSRVLSRMGFPVFQVSHARLNVNGDYIGLYILLEPVNRLFLQRNEINPLGNLYKAQVDGACANIHDCVDSVWSKKAGSGPGMNDLEELIHNIEYRSPEDFQGFMDSTFTMYGPHGLVRMLAVNAAFANNSTYYHNYYLYNDAAGTGKWLMLPWDVDKVLSENLGISYGGCTNLNWYDNPIHARTLAVPAFRNAFQDTVANIYNRYLTQDNLALWADSLETVLQKSIEDDTWDSTDFAGFRDAISELKNNLETRRTDLAWQFQYKYFPFRSFRSDSITTGNLLVSWASTEDPPGNPAVYTVVVRDSLGPDSDEIARFQGIEDTTFTITGIPLGSWWWTVETERQAVWRQTEGTDRYNPFTVVEPVELQGILQGETVLYRAQSPYLIQEEVTVPADGRLTVQAGVTLLMGENGAINCFGDITVSGTKTDSVFIIAENSSGGWRGIRLQGANLDMRYTVVSGSRGYASQPGDNFAALAGHSADVSISRSTFRNSWSCVKLHQGNALVDSCRFTGNNGELFFMEQGESAEITNSVFENLTDPVSGSFDGIEFQLCTAGEFTVRNCTVRNIDGDCIDTNSSTVTVENTTVSGSTDKGFSIGAPTGGSGYGTLVTILNSTVENCPIGIAVKDGAVVNAGNVLITGCETGLHVYEKTSGMGGGKALVENSIFTGCENSVTVDQGTGEVRWSITDTGSIPGQGNTTGDPLIDENGYLAYNSPCIDRGDPDRKDPDGSRRDIGPHFYPTVMRGLCVNELMAKNDTVILDDWGRTSDWIELYNGTGYDLDAGVLVFFGSDSSGAEQWSVPRGTMIPSMGYMLFWADGDGWKGGTHLPFRLSAGGDSFTLGRTASGTGPTPFISTVEEVEFEDQSADISFGRFPDGGQWKTLETPTPGYSNGTLYSQPVALAWPRPNPCFSGDVEIDVSVAGGRTQIYVYDLIGRRMETVHDGCLPPGESSFRWNTETVPCGVYIIFARCSGQTPATAKVTVLRR